MAEEQAGLASVHEEKPEMVVLPTPAQGRAGFCKCVDTETGAEGDTHYVIYTSVRCYIYITFPVSITLALY